MFNLQAVTTSISGTKVIVPSSISTAVLPDKKIRNNVLLGEILLAEVLIGRGSGGGQRFRRGFFYL